MKKLVGDRTTLAVKAVEIIAEELNSILKTRETVSLSLPGGTSLTELFVAFKNAKDIPWEKVHLYLVDERIAGMSNYHLVRESFLDLLVEKGVMPQDNVHPFNYHEYRNLSAPFDIIILSSGEDGHIASLFPEHHSLYSEDPCCIVIEDSPKPPPYRGTVSKTFLQRAGMAFLLFYGEKKRTALNTFLDDSTPTERCPAKMMKSVSNLYVMTDLT